MYAMFNIMSNNNMDAPANFFLLTCDGDNKRTARFRLVRFGIIMGYRLAHVLL
jgi:hypothetical protein